MPAPPKTFDIIIIGGGFSGLALLANIVRRATTPLSICIISRDGQDTFGPAYSTPRPEHLLNVRAAAMGLFADHHRGFFEWAAKSDSTISPNDYLPRRSYARYLKEARREALEEARDKGLTVDFIQAEASDISGNGPFQIETGKGNFAALNVILAIGNSLKAAENEDAGGRITGNPWAYDYDSLKDTKATHIAVIGSGLTALDAIISILNSGWQGKITCLSGSALMPQAHPEEYDAAKLLPSDPNAFLGQRLSHIFGALRRAAKAQGNDWPYVIDSLRGLTQEIWMQLPPFDRQRLAGKYFTLWNVHRHRCALEIRRQADEAMASGKLVMVRGRCAAIRPSGNQLKIEVAGGGAIEADIAFKCTGVNYMTANNPLLARLLKKGLLKDAGNAYGIGADEKLRARKSESGAIYAIGTPLFGQLFETTAVPELRAQAALIAEDITLALSGLSRSRAAAAGGSPGGRPEASATGGN